jgi:hypothetical protein
MRAKEGLSCPTTIPAKLEYPFRCPIARLCDPGSDRVNVPKIPSALRHVQSVQGV